VGVDINLKAAY